MPAQAARHDAFELERQRPMSCRSPASAANSSSARGSSQATTCSRREICEAASRATRPSHRAAGPPGRRAADDPPRRRAASGCRDPVRAPAPLLLIPFAGIRPSPGAATGPREKRSAMSNAAAATGEAIVGSPQALVAPPCLPGAARRSTKSCCFRRAPAPGRGPRWPRAAVLGPGRACVRGSRRRWFRSALPLPPTSTWLWRGGPGGWSGRSPRRGGRRRGPRGVRCGRRPRSGGSRS